MLIGYPWNTVVLTMVNYYGSKIRIRIMHIYHALINALGAHMICINLNTVFYAHVELSPTKTIDKVSRFY